MKRLYGCFLSMCWVEKKRKSSTGLQHLGTLAVQWSTSPRPQRQFFFFLLAVRCLAHNFDWYCSSDLAPTSYDIIYSASNSSSTFRFIGCHPFLFLSSTACAMRAYTCLPFRFPAYYSRNDSVFLFVLDGRLWIFTFSPICDLNDASVVDICFQIVVFLYKYYFHVDHR